MKHLSMLGFILCTFVLQTTAQNFFFHPKSAFFSQDSNYYEQHIVFDAVNGLVNNADEQSIFNEKKNRKFNISLIPVLNFTSATTHSAYLSLHSLNGINLKVTNGEKWYFEWQPTLFAGQVNANAAFFVHNNNVLYGYGPVNQQKFLMRYFHLFKWSFKPNEIFNFSLLNEPLKIGVGHYSLFADNKTAPYWQFQTSAQVWHLKYLVNIAFLSDRLFYNKENNWERKYNFTHTLSWNISKRINFNFFETVVASAYDSTGYRGFDINYLNPVIFYRPLEFGLGSPDNVLLGLALNIRVFKETVLYGQILLDEFVLSKVKQLNGWWGNKQAILAGLRAPRFLGMKNIELLGEIVFVRPFVYAHNDYSRVYGNQNQLLAYPFGSNTTEFYTSLNYTKNKFSIKTAFSAQLMASDSLPDVSLGNNPYKSYDIRNRDEGHFFLQGERHDIIRTSLNAYYYLIPDWNLYLTGAFDLSYIKTGGLMDYSGLFTLGLISTMHFDTIENLWRGMFFRY